MTVIAIGEKVLPSTPVKVEQNGTNIVRKMIACSVNRRLHHFTTLQTPRAAVRLASNRPFVMLSLGKAALKQFSMM
ncbi:MAG: hypothetical protein IPP23_15380, partial [Sphingomonadales bacterium]|nr:hypothetical protein [Sphingomonadales bacterium]